MKVLMIPLDGSELAAQALRPAEALARRWGGVEVHLVSVVSDLPPIPLASADGEVLLQWMDSERTRLGAELDRARAGLSAALPGVSIYAHLEEGPVASTIEELAGELRADLLICTTHGRGPWSRGWLGSVADQLLRSGPCPLLLMRRDSEGLGFLAEEGRTPLVLIPTDGSGEADGILGSLEALIPMASCEVVLASVLPAASAFGSSYLPHTVEEKQSLAEAHRKLVATLDLSTKASAGRGWNLRAELLEGSQPAPALLQWAEMESPDLVAIATRGRGGAARFFLGSVADKLVRGLDAPVLVLRREEAPSMTEPMSRP